MKTNRQKIKRRKARFYKQFENAAKISANWSREYTLFDDDQGYIMDYKPCILPTLKGKNGATYKLTFNKNSAKIFYSRDALWNELKNLKGTGKWRIVKI